MQTLSWVPACESQVRMKADCRQILTHQLIRSMWESTPFRQIKVHWWRILTRVMRPLEKSLSLSGQTMIRKSRWGRSELWRKMMVNVASGVVLSKLSRQKRQCRLVLWWQRVISMWFLSQICQEALGSTQTQCKDYSRLTIRSRSDKSSPETWSLTKPRTMKARQRLVRR